MIDNMTAIVQALAWTTLVGLCYAVWAHAQEPGRGINLFSSWHWRSVTNLLGTLWTLLALSLLVSAFLFVMPGALDAARDASPQCGNGKAPMMVSPRAQQQVFCGVIVERPSAMLGTWTVGKIRFAVDASTRLPEELDRVVPGARVRVRLQDPGLTVPRAIDVELLTN